MYIFYNSTSIATLPHFEIKLGITEPTGVKTWRNTVFLYFCLSGHVAGRAAQIEWASKVSWTHNLQSFVASCNAYCSGKICFYNSKSSLEIKNPSNEFGTPRPRDRSPIFCAAFTFTSSSSNALPFIRNPDISFPAAASRARASNFRSNTCCCRDRALHHHQRADI